MELAVTGAGYTVPNGVTVVQFVLDDPDGPYGKSNIELQFPNSYTGEWYTLAQDGSEASNWRIILQNVHVGDGMDMNLISEGRVLIEQLGEVGKNGKRKCRVAFEITLTDGKTAVADIEGEFKNSILWVGGK